MSTWSGFISGNSGSSIAVTAMPFTRFSDASLYQAFGGKPALLPIAVPARPFAPIADVRQGNATAMDENARTNLLNKTNFIPQVSFQVGGVPTSPVLNINSGDFGVVGGACSSRTLQFALKVNF